MPFEPLAAAFAWLSLSAAMSASCFIRLPRPRARRIAFMDQCYSARHRAGMMKKVLFGIAITTVALVISTTAKNAPPQQPAAPRNTTPTADPYANNPNAGATTLPLAAPAGRDSGATQTAPAGAMNQGAFNPATWKYGTTFNAPAGSKTWNPVKVKLQQGGKVTGGTLFSATDPATYCAMANAGYDFIWTEMQHGQTDWQQVARMWRTCPQAKAVPGVRVAYTDEREIQHALDAGALVVVVPTVDTAAEAIEARNWTYFPPLGRRSNGGGQDRKSTRLNSSH